MSFMMDGFHKLLQKGVIAALMLILLFIKPFGPALFAEEPERQIIRVGCPIQPGLSDFDAAGNCIGYTPDYLRKVAQYTDWEYDFVQVPGTLDEQILTLLDMLSSGEIDLMGAMMLNDTMAEQFDYVTSSYGSASQSLYALADNGDLNSSNYFTFPELRVAVLENADTSNAKLRQFCEMSGFHARLLPCKDDAEQMEALKSGKADVFLSIDIAQAMEGVKSIASFMPQPFYFAATKGKKDLVNKLNSTIISINDSNPFFSVELHEKYFSKGIYTFSLSSQEKAYIAQARTLRVAMIGGRAPLQYKDPASQKIQGLSPDLLDHISEMTGLRFEYVMPDTYEDYHNLLGSGEIEMAAGLYSDFKLTDNKGFNLSLPYLHAPLSLVINHRIDPRSLTGKRLALPYGLDYQSTRVTNAVYFDTVADCIKAVQRGFADYCYGNSYAVQYYLSLPENKNLFTLSQQDEWEQEFCLGVSSSIDENLLSILNKAIRSIAQSEFVQNSLYANAFQPKRVTIFSYVVSNPLQAVMVFLIIVMVFTIAMLLWTRYRDNRNDYRRRLENERYELINELSNEYLYEYNILQDRLKVPEKCAQFLGCCRITERLSEFLPKHEDGRGEEFLFGNIVTMTEGSREIRCRLPNGAQRWLRIISKRVLGRDGTPIYSVGKIVDIQPDKEFQQELLDKAQRDGLTGLYNAAATRQLVTDLLNRDDTGQGALLVIDVDRFKQINDTHGHYTGDQVLQALATVLQGAIRKDDIAGRIGGDEFLLFLRNTREKRVVAQKCDYLRKELSRLLPEVGISISIGAAFSETGISYTELYQHADNALYVMKKDGRNGYRIYREKDIVD